MDHIEKRALELFDDYLELSPRMRAAKLERLEREDPDLHRELSALLRAHARPGTLIETSIQTAIHTLGAELAAEPDGAPLVGSKVASWRITDIIGRGGMGTVYRAERADGQYQQTVALKYIRDEVASPRLVSAFVNERNVLARLAHPDIVPLLDGGIDDSGRPWYAMQLIDGRPIDQWCDARRLSVRDRVALLARACEPVAYAHRNGVLHQDIKPPNILVTDDGRPRLLDFGLSILTAADDAGQSHRIALTSGYMPPEAMLGSPAGVQADVYALGVVLYQLLCGHYPAGLGTLQHRLLPPSKLAVRLDKDDLQARSATSGPALARQLRGDLDRIALRCVATDPGMRYASVEMLRMDLDGWLQGRPISVNEGAWARNAVAFLRSKSRPLAVLAGLALLAAACMLGFQAWRGEREAALSSQTDRFFESVFGMAAVSGLGDIPTTPTGLLEHSEHQLRQQADPGQPRMLARGLSILARSWAVAGNYDKAEALAVEARNMAGRLDTLQSAFNLATLARIQNLQARHLEAEATAREGLIALSFRLTTQHQLAYLRLLAQQAAAQSGQGRSREAFETLNAAISKAETLSGTSGNEMVADLLVQRGTWQRWRLNMKESEADLLRAIELASGSNPILADDARESLLRTVRASRKPGREDRALDMTQRLLESRRTTLGERHPLTGTALAELALLQSLKQDYADAQASNDLARDILTEALGPEHPAVARTYTTQTHLSTLVDRDLDASLEYASHANRIYERHYGPHHEFTLDSRVLLGLRFWGRGRGTDTPADLEKARDLIGSAIADSVEAHGDVTALYRAPHADLLRQTGRMEEAVKELEQGRRDAARQYGADSEDAMTIRLVEGRFLLRHGEDDPRTEQVTNDLIRDASAIDTHFAARVGGDMLQLYAQWLSSRSRHDEALAAARRGLQLAERREMVDQLPDIEALIRKIETDAQALDSQGQSGM